MTIRPGRPAEAGVLADLWLRSQAASVPAIPPPVHTDAEVTQWFTSVVLPEREVWVVDGGTGPVGLMVLEGDWVDQLYVNPSATGRGIGTLLIEHAKGLRVGGLQLWTFAANVGARRFYERHGFVAVDFTNGDNEEGAPDVRYEWSPGRVTPIT